MASEKSKHIAAMIWEMTERPELPLEAFSKQERREANERYASTLRRAVEGPKWTPTPQGRIYIEILSYQLSPSPEQAGLHAVRAANILRDFRSRHDPEEITQEDLATLVQMTADLIESSIASTLGEMMSKPTQGEANLGRRNDELTVLSVQPVRQGFKPHRIVQAQSRGRVYDPREIDRVLVTISGTHKTLQTRRAREVALEAARRIRHSSWRVRLIRGPACIGRGGAPTAVYEVE